MERWQIILITSGIFSLFFVDIPHFSLLIWSLVLSGWLLFKQKWGFRSLLGIAILSVSWFFIQALWQTHWQLPPSLIKKPANIIGVVSNIPSRPGENLRFNLQLTSIGGEKLHWYTQYNQPTIKLNWQKANQTLRLGDTVQLTAKLKPAYGFANQGGFSYQKWLMLQGIRATGYVVGQQPVKVIEPSTSFRQLIFDRLSQATANLDYQGLLVALTMGEKQFISVDQWQTIKATGISHLLAISGLHIGIVFLFSAMLAKLLVKLYCFVFNQNHNAPLIALFFGLVGALFYSWLAGFSIPTVRALLMLTLLVLTLSLKRVANSKTVILNTLALLLVIQPLSILEPGLWLSFLAVIVIIGTFWWFPTINRNSDKTPRWVHKFTGYVQSMVKMQLVLFVLLVPVTIVVFNGFSIFSGVVNLIAVPWVSFVTVPIALMAAVLTFFDLPAPMLFALADSSLASLFNIIEQPWTRSGWVTVKFMPWYAWVLLVAFMLSFLVSVSKPLRGLSFLLLLPPLMFMLKTHPGWRVDILDVGQGLSVVIEKNNRALIYDLGPVYKSGFNTVEHVVLPYLAYHGHDTVDYLVISHSDSDHAGAYKKFFSKVTAKQTIAPLKLLPEATVCDAGLFLGQEQRQWQGLTLEVLWPLKNTRLPTSSNDSSCVIRVSNAQFSVLLPGDISKRVEQRLIKHYGGALASTILVAPHHGSHSSSSQAFVDAVKPDYVVYSTGYLNRYRFPREKVVKRYDKINAVQLNTAISGQISFVITDEGLQVQQARQHLLPNWYYNR